MRHLNITRLLKSNLDKMTNVDAYKFFFYRHGSLLFRDTTLAYVTCILYVSIYGASGRIGSFILRGSDVMELNASQFRTSHELCGF